MPELGAAAGGIRFDGRAAKVDGALVIIRRELPEDIDAIREVTAAAFRGVPHSAPAREPGGDPGEAALVSDLRQDASWLPHLSLVAVDDEGVFGHVVATRAHVGSEPALGLGPLSVVPNRQRTGVGSALVHAVLGAADALDEILVALLGDPRYYGRFGFRPSDTVGITAPDPLWGAAFQVRTLTRYDGVTGRFRYAQPFDLL